MKTKEERERENRSGKTEQPTNNKPAAGERGNKEEIERRAQKTTGKHQGNTEAKRDR